MLEGGMVVYSITDALVYIQKELRVPKVNTNSFGGYQYRSAENILSALKPILSEICAAVTMSDEVVDISGRFYVRSTATLALGRDTVSVMDDAQITGSASSYARKCALGGLFAIDDTQDADASNKHEQVEQKDIIHFRRKVRSTFSCYSDMNGLVLEAGDHKTEAIELGDLEWLKVAFAEHAARIGNEQMDKGASQ
jgi:hypothetical protein